MDESAETTSESEAAEARELRLAQAWNVFALCITAIEAAGAFTVQLLYTVGLSKIVGEVLGPVSGGLDDFWSALLMVDWTFEEYLVFFVVFYTVICSLDSVQIGARYYCSKRVEQLLKVKLARALLEEGGKASTWTLDDTVEMNKCIVRLRLYVEETKYEQFWDFSLISFGMLFTLILAPELFGILLVSNRVIMVYIKVTAFV